MQAGAMSLSIGSSILSGLNVSVHLTRPYSHRDSFFRISESTLRALSQRNHLSILSISTNTLLRASIHSYSWDREQETSPASKFPVQGLEDPTSAPRSRRGCVQCRASADAGPEIEIVKDEDWEGMMRKQTAEREEQREEQREEERSKEAAYKNMTQELQNFPREAVKEARKFVANLIRSGEKIEETIVEAADNGELSPLVLLVIKNRLELARQDDEREASQALDLLYRRVETEMLSRQASPAMQLLNELLHLHDGISREEWLRRSRLIMLQIFPPEDAFSILGGPAFDLTNQHGLIEMPEEEDDVLLRIDFIREVNDFLSELHAQPKIEPLQGFDAPSIAIRLRQEERLRAMEQVKDLRDLAIKLQR